MSKTVVLVGSLDTKGEPFQFVRNLLQARGLNTIVVDFGVLGDPPFHPDIDNEQLARAGGSEISTLRSSRDKTLAMHVMAQGLAKVVTDLFDSGQLDGILGMAGGSGTSIVTRAMRELPVGVPKMMLSTVASAGDVSQYIGSKDITMMPAVVDVAGLNSISRQIYSNAAGAIAGMVQQPSLDQVDQKPLITASMFGNTTECVQYSQEILEDEGFEVLVFHTTGSGGKTMESLITAGFITANLDLTTTELADQVCGGVMSAGPERLQAAAEAGIPTVLAPGCVDMVNFWGPDTVPNKYKNRQFYEWNPDVTLMRTNEEENRKIGIMIAKAANRARGPVAIMIPRQGFSQLDSPGGKFWYPAADQACIDSIRENLNPEIAYIEMDNNINDPEFARAAVGQLLQMGKKEKENKSK